MAVQYGESQISQHFWPNNSISILQYQRVDYILFVKVFIEFGFWWIILKQSYVDVMAKWVKAHNIKEHLRKTNVEDDVTVMQPVQQETTPAILPSKI